MANTRPQTGTGKVPAKGIDHVARLGQTSPESIGKATVPPTIPPGLPGQNPIGVREPTSSGGGAPL